MTSYGKHLSFPFQIGKDGRTKQVKTLEEHIRQELIQLILTNPGERANLPEFGGGVRLLVFEGTDSATESLAKVRITQAISRWLGHRVTLESLDVISGGGRIEAEIRYRITGTEDLRIMRFQRASG